MITKRRIRRPFKQPNKIKTARSGLPVISGHPVHKNGITAAEIEAALHWQADHPSHYLSSPDIDAEGLVLLLRKFLRARIATSEAMRQVIEEQRSASVTAKTAPTPIPVPPSPRSQSQTG